jgi:hypothetical protein
MAHTVLITEEELGEALSDHASEQYADESYDYQTSEVTYYDHTCHASCAEDIIRRILKGRQP